MSRTAYPLCWPTGWPKTDAFKRERARFQKTLAAALSNLEKQIRLMGGKNLMLSSNYTLGAQNPKEPGVVAYFEWNGTHVAIPCDRWTCVADNVHAIGLTIGAMRGMDRWGAKAMIQAMFTGFKALPETAGAGTSWWEVLEVPPTATLEQALASYRALAKKAHPDAGGSHDAFVRLQRAFAEAEAHHKKS